MSLYPAETHSGVVTSWIPLTTTYTPSAACSTHYRQNGPSLVAFDPGYGLDVDSKVICAPPAVTTWWEQGLLGNKNAPGHTFASLGPMVCPQSWSTVTTSISNDISTVAMCCPYGYTLANTDPDGSWSRAGDCQSPLQSGDILTYAFTADKKNVFTITTTTLTGSSYAGAIAVVGWNVRPNPTTASAISSTSSTFSTSATLPTAQAETGTSKPALSTGAEAGIGVGVALFVLSIAGLVALFFLHQEKARAKVANGTDMDHAHRCNDYPTNTSDKLPQPYLQAELQGHSVPQQPVELSAN